jgi:hypothetical protein
MEQMNPGNYKFGNFTPGIYVVIIMKRLVEKYLEVSKIIIVLDK